MSNKAYNSVSVNIIVKAGAANDVKHGTAHFLEHMIFRGNTVYDSKYISEVMDNIGGELNAYTSREITCFYAKSLGVDLEIILDLLSSMIFHSQFKQSHIDLEKTVILDELMVYEDDPEESIQDFFAEKVFAGTCYSHPILGTKESIESIERQDLVDFFDYHYHPENIVIAISGNFDEDIIMTLLDLYFGIENKQRKPVNKTQIAATAFHKGKSYHKKYKSEQLQILIGFDGLPNNHEYSSDLLALNFILGGGNSSLLFQRIREDLGLAYSVQSDVSFYDEFGCLSVSMAVNPEMAKNCIIECAKILKTIKNTGVTEKQLHIAKKHLRAAFLLSLEGSENYAEIIGRTEAFNYSNKDVESILHRIDDISLERIAHIIDSIFKECSFTTLGNISDEDAKGLHKIFMENYVDYENN